MHARIDIQDWCVNDHHELLYEAFHNAVANIASAPEEQASVVDRAGIPRVAEILRLAVEEIDTDLAPIVAMRDQQDTRFNRGTPEFSHATQPMDEAAHLEGLHELEASITKSIALNARQALAARAAVYLGHWIFFEPTYEASHFGGKLSVRAMLKCFDYTLPNQATPGGSGIRDSYLDGIRHARQESHSWPVKLNPKSADWCHDIVEERYKLLAVWYVMYFDSLRLGDNF